MTLAQSQKQAELIKQGYSNQDAFNIATGKPIQSRYIGPLDSALANNTSSNPIENVVTQVPQANNQGLAYINNTDTVYDPNGGTLGLTSNLHNGQTVINPDGTTTTGGYLWDSTSKLNYNDFNAANGGKISLADYNNYQKNQIASNNSGLSNTLGYTNAAIGGLGLLGNLYYAEQNKRAQEKAAKYARSRDALADAKTAKFQRNLV